MYDLLVVSSRPAMSPPVARMDLSDIERQKGSPHHDITYKAL
jgi:hypothetical protein